MVNLILENFVWNWGRVEFKAKLFFMQHSILSQVHELISLNSEEWNLNADHNSEININLNLRLLT